MDKEGCEQIKKDETDIDDLSFGLLIVLVEMKTALCLFEVINENTDQIKKHRKYSAFLSYSKILLLKDFSLNACKILEKIDKKYDKYSIPAIIVYIRKHKLNLVNEKPLQDYLGCQKFESETVCRALEEKLIAFRKSHLEEIKRYKKFRNKEIAHSEFINDEDKIKYLPSIDVMWDFVDFCSKFCVAVRSGYAQNIFYIGTHKETYDSLLKLLKDSGIDDVVVPERLKS